MKNFAFLLHLVFILSAVSVFGQNRELVLEDSSKPEQKFALVIGNGAYESSPLKNPVNDARAIGQALSALGFQVILKENVNQVEMKRAVREFGEKIKNGGIGLFYFAGHGVQVKGQNYLVPIGAQITKEEEAEYEGLDVGFVMAQMEAAKNRMNIVILDACRNNPFARSFRSESNGLASISAPSGTLIAYATAPGSVASDGDGQNGLYTQELLFNMKTIGLSIEEVFKRVRISVREKTQGNQTPWESSSLTGDFYFVKSGDVKPNTANQQIQIPSADSTTVELAFWDTVKNSSDIKDFKAYLKEYPNGRFVTLAQNRVTALEGNIKEANLNTPQSTTINNPEGNYLVGYKFQIGYKTADATILADRLRSLGATVKLFKLSFIARFKKLYYKNSDKEIAIKIAKSIEDIIQVELTSTDEGKAKEFALWLQ